MSVKELINALAKLPPDAPVVYYDGEAGGQQPVQSVKLTSSKNYDVPVVELFQ